jgi:hypothetical protein
MRAGIWILACVFAGSVVSLVPSVAEADQSIHVDPVQNCCQPSGATITLPPGIHTFTYEAGAWSAWSSDSDPGCYTTGCWFASVVIDAPDISFYQRLGTLDRFFTPEEAENAHVGSQVIMDASYSEVMVYVYVGDTCPQAYCHDNRGGPITVSVATISGLNGESQDWLFALGANDPNPFSSCTSIRYSLSRASQTSLNVFDVKGASVLTLARGHREAGPHLVIWDGKSSDGSTVPPGIYFIRLQAGDRVATQKVVLVR